jgi:hypothetical protein
MVDIRNKCLGDDLAPSQRLGDVIVSQGIEGLMFPSQAGAGTNLVVYRKCCDPNALKIENEAELLAAIAGIAKSAKWDLIILIGGQQGLACIFAGQDERRKRGLNLLKLF